MRAKSVLLLCIVGALAFAANAHAAVIFQEDFETQSMSNWSNLTDSDGPMDISSAQNKVPDGGSFSALIDHSGDGVYHNLGSEISGDATLDFWLYDGGQTRAFAEIRAYSGAGVGGTLQQLFAIGRYDSIAGSAGKYQARVLYGTGTTGWFNLDGTTRSTDWHHFQIERMDDGTTVNFYVDGALAKTVTNAAGGTLDSVLMTSARAGTTVGNAWFDGIVVTDTAIPEPATLSLLAIGGLGLLARRRKA